MILRCHVDDKTLAILQRFAAETGRSVEHLAEACIAEGACIAERADPAAPRPGASTSKRVARNCAHWRDGICDRCGAQHQGCEVSADFGCPHFSAR